MDWRTLAVVVALSLLIGAGAGYALRGPVTPCDPEPTPVPGSVVETQQAAPQGGLTGSQRPDTETRYVEIPGPPPQACEPDSFFVYLPAPRDVIGTGEPVVTTDTGVDVRRPVFSDPVVDFRYYDPADQRVEVRSYAVPPNPLHFGLATDAYVAWSANGPQPGVGLGAFTGYNSLTTFARVGYDPGLDLNARLGVRWTLGRR